jgi:hypothetical protein
MQLLLAPFMWVAVAGFVASLLVHILALMGLASPFGSATWLLHVGIFVVWFPTVLIAQRLTRGAKQVDFWKATFRGCPGWAKAGAYVVGGYAMLNFVFFALQTSRYPRNEIPDIVEYRGFSGHWMAFYYVGAATLYSGTKRGSSSPRHCANGHEVSPFAKYCDVCGIRLQSQEQA